MHLQLQQSHVQLWSRTNKPKHCCRCRCSTRCEYLQLPSLPLWPQVQYLFNPCVHWQNICPQRQPHICRLKLHIHHPQRLQGHNSSDEAVTNVGSGKCVYRLVIHAPASIQVSIALWRLTLKQKGETLFHHSKACSQQTM